MRRKDKHLSDTDAWALFERAPALHVAGAAPDGRPVLRTVNAVVWRGGLAFHGAPAGEKLELLGQPVVAQVEEVVADIPSHWFHPERACPATTWYRSAQAHGRLLTIDDPDEKAEVLEAIMRRYQPEGGYRPIRASDPMYAAVVRNLLVARVEVDEVTAKAGVGQNLAPEARARVLGELWRRGAPGDVAAIDACREASPPDEPPPPFLEAPAGARLRLRLRERDVADIVALAHDTYWNRELSAETVAAAQRGSAAWVGAFDPADQLVGSARAVTDTAKHGYIGDVIVAPAWRGRGLGQALMRALLDHPAVRRVRHVDLHTRDAMGFYARLGFQATRMEGDRTVMRRSI